MRPWAAGQQSGDEKDGKGYYRADDVDESNLPWSVNRTRDNRPSGGQSHGRVMQRKVGPAEESTSRVVSELVEYNSNGNGGESCREPSRESSFFFHATEDTYADDAEFPSA
jgi:hypothetical protein